MPIKHAPKRCAASSSRSASSLVPIRIGRPGLPLAIKAGKGGKRRARAPMAAQQNVKCPGSDIFAAQEPQPVETLAVVEGAKRFRAKRSFVHALVTIRD